MNTVAVADEPGSSAAIPLRFEITADEIFAWTRQLPLERRMIWMVWLRRVAALGMAYLAIDFATDGEWIIAALMALSAVSTWSHTWGMLWFMRRLFGRMTVHWDLELDAGGIRGEFICRSGRKWGNDQRRVNYAWNRLRKIERLPELLLFEFHGGLGAGIPLRAFVTRADAEQCLAWAEQGLAQQRKSRRVSSAAAAEQPGC